MKLRLLLLTCLALTFSPALFAHEQPGVDIIKAAKLASDTLARRGDASVYITSLAIDQGAIISGQSSWVAHWSKPIVVDGSTEVGVRIKSDGTVVRLVEGKGTHSTRQPAALDIR